MDRVSFQQIRDLLQKNDKVAIAVGANPTIDDMAGALSLYLGLQQMNKSASIASPSEPTVELSSLVGINKVRPQFEGDGGDLVVSFPYNEGEIEKVSYTIDNGFLNIVVKAGEMGLTFSERDVRFQRGGGVPGILFVVGTPRLSDLGPLFDPEALKNTTVVNVDNKGDNQGYGDVVLVDPQSSSVSEIVANLLTTLGVDMDVDVAQNLLSGISYATENFQNPRTSFGAFEVSGMLMRKGAVRSAGIPTPGRAQPYPQNEDRVSSFMPETMRSQGAGMTTSRPPMPPQRQQPVQQPQIPSMPQPRPAAPQQQTQTQDRKPPSDWLTPKVYKGSQTPIE